MKFEVGPIIARSLWPALIAKFPAGPLHPHVKRIRNQGVMESCNAYATAPAVEFLRSIARLEDVELDADEMFSRVESPGGGSHLTDVIEQAIEKGFKPLGQLRKVLWCPTFDHQMSQILFGRPIVSIHQDFVNYKPDSTGWLPKGKGSPVTHTMMGFKPEMRPTGTGSIQFGIRHLQSYGAKWSPATHSTAILSEEQLTGDPGSGGSFALLSIHDEGVER